MSRQERRAERAKTPEANSASTYGSGAVTTTRDSANVGVTTGDWDDAVPVVRSAVADIDIHGARRKGGWP